MAFKHHSYQIREIMWSDSVEKRGPIYCCLTNLCFQIPVISIGIHVTWNSKDFPTWTLPRLPTESNFQSVLHTSLHC